MRIIFLSPILNVGGDMDILAGKINLLRHSVKEWECHQKVVRCAELVDIKTLITEIYLMTPTSILFVEETTSFD